jgi:hypothetical protein
MAPRKPTKKPAKQAPKATAKVALKAAPKALMAKAAAPKAAAPIPHNPATCVCPCHSPIDPKKYGCWCNCHVLALLCQKGTLAAWLLTATLIVVTGQGLALATGGMAGSTADFVISVLLALPFALLFRMAYTGCGGLVEGLKLGLIIMAPIGIMMAGLHYSAGATVLEACVTGGISLVQGAILGSFCAWLLKPAGRTACCK